MPIARVTPSRNSGNRAYTAFVGAVITSVLVYLMAVLFTELLTNNAAAILVFPVAVGVAGQLGVDPMPFVVALMVGASAGFMTPIGYQTNLFVYGPGGYRFTDFARVGGPLNLLMLITAAFVIPRFFPF